MAEKKGFFQEFKTFISRGNVVDLAVGMIIGSSFTAIVTALSNGILKPVINALLALFSKDGSDPLASAYTILRAGYSVDETGAKVLDLAKSIYIDWGNFISAVINFLLVALVLFTIVKVINTLREKEAEARKKLEARFAKDKAEETTAE